MSYPPKVLVVSNSLTTGPLWAYSLQERKFDVIMEPNPAKLLRRWAEETPNLIVLDFGAPERPILNMVRSLREESVVPVILLTSSKEEEYVLEAYDSGVDEYILKPISPSLFHAKVKAWLRRSWSVPTGALDPLKVGKVHLIPAEQSVAIDDHSPIHLTSLELRLLFILMSRPTRTVAAEELIQRVWGYSGEADHTVLKNVIYRLRRKIEAEGSDPPLIQTVAGVGYKFVSE
jgi:DNA-binding response OmpR family regulator